jgi:hypothetical protein
MPATTNAIRAAPTQSIRPSSTTGSDEPTMHNTVPVHSTIMMPSSTHLRPM